MRLQAAFHLLRLKLRSMVPLDQTGHTLNTFIKSLPALFSIDTLLEIIFKLKINDRSLSLYL